MIEIKIKTKININKYYYFSQKIVKSQKTIVFAGKPYSQTLLQK